jgi:hypothetical protein
MKTNLRKEAKGRECQIRIPTLCNGNSETVVLCHPNSKSVFGAGVGSKPDDIFGAYGCSSCHDRVDGRIKGRLFSDDEIKIMFYEAIFRTQNILLSEGKIGEL